MVVVVEEWGKGKKKEVVVSKPPPKMEKPQTIRPPIKRIRIEGQGGQEKRRAAVVETIEKIEKEA